MFKKSSFILLAVFFALVPLCAHAEAELNKPAPALVVKQLDGQTFSLVAAKGRVVLVNFWATWCPPCRDEMPLLNVIYKRYRGQGLAMIGVSTDREKHRDDVVKVMRGIEYPAALLSDAQANDFGWMPQLPTTYIIDRKGVVRVIFSPDQTPVSEKTLIDMIEPLLGQ